MMNSYNGIPNPVLIFVALIIIFTFIATQTKFGRNVYAIGGNKEAAQLSGINVKRNVLWLYVITGLLSAVSSVLLTARMDGATASAGTSYEMDVISACVLGGTSLTGGKGTIVGAVIGALIIASLDNGMSLMNLSYNYQSMVKGLVLILAVWFDVANQVKK
jgi:D-xylose transport system permease protein